MIKAITFDLDGVYFVNGKENFIKNLGIKYAVSEDEAKRVFLKSDRMNNQYKRGLDFDESFWLWAINDEWKITASWKEVVKLLIDGYEENPPVVELVKKLRSRGYKILACSNNFPARVSGLNEKFGFLANFDTAVFSYEVGVVKPASEIFEHLILESGCQPEEIVVADDDPTKIIEAGKLGLNTFVYQNFPQFCQELEQLGIKI